MKNYKTLKIIIIILAIATIINVAAIIYVDGLLNAPLTSTQTEVLGAAIIEDSPENTIDINLIRPPRVAVKAGDTVRHKRFGIGTIAFIDKAEKKMRIKFAMGEKTFLYPDAFVQGHLTVE